MDLSTQINHLAVQSIFLNPYYDISPWGDTIMSIQPIGMSISGGVWSINVWTSIARTQGTVIGK